VKCRRTHLALSFLIAALSSTSSARAQDESDEAHVRRGIELRGEGHDEEALREFETAMAIRATPRTLAQIALAHQALGHWVAAESSLDEALVATSDPWIARHRDILRQAHDAIDSHLGSLSVEANVPGATLTVDSRFAGTLPLAYPIRVPAGTVFIEVRAPGYVDAHRAASIIAGMQATETVRLDPSPKPSEPPSPVTEPASEHPVAEHRALQPNRAAPVAALTDATKIAPTPQASERPSIAGVFTVMGGAVLGVAAFGAERVREHDVEVYNDSSRCVFGDLTREQRCGAYRSGADVALGVEIGLIAAASVATLVGEWLIATSMKRSSPRIEHRAWTAPGALGVFRF
jgi:hypothetical protein